MALSKVPWCDFIIYTFKNYTIQRIRFDSEFWDNIQTNLTEFYFKHLLPKAPTYVVAVSMQCLLSLGTFYLILIVGIDMKKNGYRIFRTSKHTLK